MSRQFLRVGKVGGSLFDFAELPTALRSWIDDQPGANVLIAGGGPFADAIRKADEVFQLGESKSHRLAIEAMRVSAALLQAMLPEARFARSLADVSSGIAQGGVVVFDPAETLISPACELSQSWHVTSDAIAAYIATELRAQELVLFKSTVLPSNTTRLQAAESGLVDKAFVEAAASLSTVRWVNLRGNPVTERPL